MQFCVARKKKILSRPHSATPKLYRAIRPCRSPQAENFSVFFFGEDKECQTFCGLSKGSGVSICQRFLRSHRDSIEREVVSIFQNESRVRVNEEVLELKENGQKREGFKMLLRQARGVKKPLRLVEERPSICVRKLRIGEKVRKVSCNRLFESPRISKKKFQVMGPGLRTGKYGRSYKGSVRGVMYPIKVQEKSNHNLQSLVLEGWNTIK